MLEEFYLTVPDLPSWAEIEEHIAAEERAANRPRMAAKRQTAPRWAVVCVVVGLLLLVASSLFLLTWGEF